MRFLDYIWRFLDGIWYLVRTVFYGIARTMYFVQPFKTKVSVAPAVRYFLWFGLTAVLLALLYFLNWYFDIAPAVRVAWAERLWLPILGLLVVLIGVVLYWLYLLGKDDDVSPFPDILEAWREAVQALDHAGIRLTDVPLFLVLGRPETSEKNLFDASGMELLVRQAPANPKSPLFVFANHSAVYVTCRGASLLGRLASILALEEMHDASVTDEEERFANETLKLKPGMRVRDIIKKAQAADKNTLILRAIRRALSKPLGPDFLSDAAEVARLKARLGYLCRLIARDRQPYCPANGVLMLVPLGATDTPDDHQQAAQACQEDLAVLREEMKQDCPVLSLVVDMEDFPGFVEFIKHTSPEELERRLGQRFPMATKQLSAAQIKDQIERSLRWACTTYLQDHVFRQFQVEGDKSPEPNALFPGNARLFLMLDEMRRRAESLAAIISQSVVMQDQTVLRYAGCYLAATGPNGSQGFVPGVLQRLVDEQSCVGWTDKALIEDEDCHTWARYYSIMAGVLALIFVAILYFRTWGG